jgi:hypothetical protein
MKVYLEVWWILLKGYIYAPVHAYYRRRQTLSSKYNVSTGVHILSG